MKHLKLFAAILFFAAGNSFAQTAPPADLVTIQQGLKKLNVLGSVLYVAAHPDDENTRLLAYLAQEKNYRTGYLSLTRGDGGQNLIGNEQSEVLGLIRTQELLAARRVDGAEQFFSRANDFGFSKGPEETLKIWDREKVLGDAVWVIRNFRPDVIICRFPTTGEGGHGHHTSSAIIAQEAFTAAADPKRFPEQLKYVKVWQAKRLLFNGFNFGTVNTTSQTQFKVDVGVYNPIIGRGYGEVAADSRSNHKSQGFGSAKQRGSSLEYFKTISGDEPKVELLDGVNTTWSRVKGGDAIAADLATIKKNFDLEHPEKSVPALVALLDKVEKVDDEYWREQKAKQLKDIIAACAGLWFEAYVDQPSYAIGETIKVSSQIVSRFNDRLKIDVLHNDAMSFNTHDILTSENVYKAMPLKEVQTLRNDFYLNQITQPYWLTDRHPIGMYKVLSQSLIGNPENVDRLEIPFNFVVAGKTISFKRKLMFKYVDPAKGEIYQPVVIAPPVTANIVNKDYVFNTQQPQTIQIKLQSFTNAMGSISLKPITGWRISPAKIDFVDKPKGSEWVASFDVVPTDAKPKNDVLQAIVTVGGKDYSMGIQRVAYDHIPAITFFPPAETKLINIDLKTAGKRIGYIAGAGDVVPEALMQVGYSVTQLTESDIMNADLSVYDAIVIGVRAYNINQRLIVEQPRLMNYVDQGGNLVVQYNVHNGLVNTQIGPYPFKIVNQRVTDEHAPVTFLDPSNPVLNYPNKITKADFDGWVQERGLYFVSSIDSHYKTPLRFNDPGESPNPGSLIVADHGKGRFVYTSLAFFRQLPAGVPGAYRLFVNLLSKPKN